MEGAPTGAPSSPQLIPLFEVERYLLASEWLQRRYRYHSSHAISASYHVHLFMRLAR